MKKFTAIIMIISVILCLTSCGKKSAQSDENGKNGLFEKASSETADKTSAVSTTMPQEEVSHVAKKLEKGRLGSFDSYSEEEKAEIKKQVEKDGYTLEYNEDGSGTLSNEEGTWFVGKGWVDNEYTVDVPPIDFGTVTMSSEYEEGGESCYIFLVRNVTAVRAQEYVDSLKAAGFSEVGENESNPDLGVVTFAGERSDGRHIEAAYSLNGFTVKIYTKN